MIVDLSEERGITVVLCSHQLHQVQRICHRVGVMMRGRLIAQHSMAELGREGGGLEKMYMNAISQEA
jgi:ABC-2 type transport system ATP-binding protein